MPPLTLRQEFPTLRHFKEALHAWAIEAHFEPRILKSDTGRVRVGCKRDPNCPFVIRCNWERKNGREPLARVTVLKERHTCLNGLGSNGMGVGAGAGNGEWREGDMIGGGDMGMGGTGVNDMGGGLEIRTAQDGSIIGGARVLGPVPRAQVAPPPTDPGLLPVLPKVQRNSASRLPFLMEILPRLMRITKETTPVEIRECLMREYGAEVHLQQCRRAKTEILKRATEGGGSDGQQENGGGSSIDGLGEPDTDTGPHHNPSMFTTPNGNGQQEQQQGQSTPSTMHATPNMTAGSIAMNANIGDPIVNVGGDAFPLHTASGVVIPQATPRREAALNAVGEPPVRCPYCVNHRWMRTVRDAVEHMSMHVVV